MAFNLEWRQVRLGLIASSVVFGFVLIALKPYLPRALYHSGASIYDHRIFPNRIVRRSPEPKPWRIASKKSNEPSGAIKTVLQELKTTALLMIDHGEIAFEEYFDDGGPSVVSGTLSMTKSLMAILVGMAIRDGDIKGLTVKASEYIPEWDGKPEGQIEIRHLLQMTSGLDWNESYSNPFSIMTEAYFGSRLLNTVFKQRLRADPGSVYSYQSGNSQLLAVILARALNQNLSEYASRRLWQPLGAETDALWSVDHDGGVEKAFCCFSATARDIARVGELVLNQGVLDGVNLIDPKYLSEMIRPHGVVNAKGESVDYYGNHWWIYRSSRGEVPYARGFFGQYLIVLPEKHRVIVRFGKESAERVGHHPKELAALVEWGLAAQ